MDYINQNTIANLDSVIKPMPSQIPLGWKPRKANHAHIHSNAQTAEEIIRQTPTNVHFGDTNSTESSIRRSTSRFGKTE